MTPNRKTLKRKIIVKGPRAHDVGYRLCLLEEAEALFIPYLSARNIENETQIVEVLVGGEKEAVDRFVEFAQKNFPKDAEVASVSVEEYDGEIRTTEDFSRSLSVSQLYKIARTGKEMLAEQDEHIQITKGGFKEILAKHEEHIQITKGGFKEILAKHEEHIQITKDGFESVASELRGFRELHEEVRELKEEFNKLKESVARIERKIEA